MAEMSNAQVERQRQRDGGRYSKFPPCEICGKSAGAKYLSLESCNETGFGLTICQRKKCWTEAERREPEEIEKAKQRRMQRVAGGEQ